MFLLVRYPGDIASQFLSSDPGLSLRMFLARSVLPQVEVEEGVVVV